MAKLFDLVPVGLVLSTFIQYSFIFRSISEVASDVISSKFVKQIVSAKAVTFCYFGLHRSSHIDSMSWEMTFFARVSLELATGSS